MVFYQTQFIIKRLEQFFWVEKTLQNKTLKIIEQNITAKYFRYLNLPFSGHDSKTLDTCQGQKRLTTLKYVCFLFKARLQLQEWIDLSRTNILKQIYYEVRYGSVEVLQWISAYSNLFQVNYSEV